MSKAAGVRSVHFNSYISKIICLTSLLCILVFGSLTFLTVREINSILLSHAMDSQETIVENLQEYLEDKKNTIQSIVNQLYIEKSTLESSKLSSFYSLLQNNYSSVTNPQYISAVKALRNSMESILSRDPSLVSVTIAKSADDVGYFCSRSKMFTFSNYQNALDYYLTQNTFIPHSELVGTLRSVSTCFSDYLYQKKYNNSNNTGRGSTYAITMPLVVIPSNTCVGTLILEYSSSEIDALLSASGLTDGGSLYITDRFSELVYSSSDGIPSSLKQLELSSNWSRVMIENQEAYAKIIDNCSLDATIYWVLPLDTLFAPSIRMVRRLISASIIGVFVCILISALISRNANHRVKNITETMHQMRSGNLNLRIAIGRHVDEFSEISESFNEMTENLQIYITQVYESELSRKKLQLSQQAAQIHALQAQIQPHFLYNTLEAIRMQSVLDDSPKSAEMVRILAEMLKQQIHGDMIVSLQDDLRTCELSLKLFGYRHQGSISFTINAQPETLSLGIMKNSLQPLLENYLVHGFDARRSDNHVIIQCRLCDAGEHTDLCVEMIDNGLGITSERLEEINKQLSSPASKQDEHGVGLFNVHRRAKLVFGEKYGCTLESIENLRTRVCLTIPAISEGELKKNVHCSDC